MQNLLFVGTEIGVYASLDRGKSWFSLRSNMPKVAIHDLVIHPREGDLIAGTHGRSIWILDDISALRSIAKLPVAGELVFLSSRTSTRWQEINTGRKQVDFEFRGQNPHRGMQFQFWLAPEQTVDSITYTVKHPDGRFTRRKAAARPGLNRLYWNGIFPPSKDQSANISLLLTTIDQLQARFTDADERLALQQLYADIVKLRQNYNTEIHQNLWDQLAHTYGHYGYPLSPKPRPEEATPGTYDIEITAGDLRTSGTITFREDPLLGE